MPAVVDFSLVGGKELQRDLEQLEPKVQKQISRKTLRNAAKRTAKEVRKLAPVETGKLRKKGIIVRAVKLRSGKIGVHIMFNTRDKLGIPADAKGFYPAILEYGVPGRIKPYAFMRRGFDITENANLQQIRNDLGRMIEQSLRGGKV